MVGRLTDLVLLSYRTPAASVAGLLPEGLELVTRGPWAFWNVVACRVVGMRPGFPGGIDAPEALGVNYHHVAYRLLVQAMTNRADVRRGLYFLRSDADARVLGTVGNWTTDFRFHAADIALDAAEGRYALDVKAADGRADAVLRLGSGAVALPPGSCFPTPTDAQEFLKYQPYALAVTGDAGCRRLRIAEVRRDESAWRETPVAVERAELSYFASIGQDGVELELATRVEPMDYVWKLGRTEPLLGQHERPTPAVAEVARSA
ncbi:MAG: DUF2071 domain-containing protein [Planctomycetota bacterium]